MSDVSHHLRFVTQILDVRLKRKIPNSMIVSDLVEEGNWPNKMHLRRTKPARELRQALQGNKMLPRGTS